VERSRAMPPTLPAAPRAMACAPTPSPWRSWAKAPSRSCRVWRERSYKGRGSSAKPRAAQSHLTQHAERAEQDQTATSRSWPSHRKIRGFACLCGGRFTCDAVIHGLKMSQHWRYAQPTDPSPVDVSAFRLSGRGVF